MMQYMNDIIHTLYILYSNTFFYNIKYSKYLNTSNLWLFLCAHKTTTHAVHSEMCTLKNKSVHLIYYRKMTYKLNFAFITLPLFD